MIKLTLICPSHLRKISMSSLVSPTLNALVSEVSMVSTKCLFEADGIRFGCLMVLAWCFRAVMQAGSRSKRKIVKMENVLCA